MIHQEQEFSGGNWMIVKQKADLSTLNIIQR